MSGRPLDPRLNAFRRDLADRRLRGRIEAPRFADGVLRAVVAPVADMRTGPSPRAALGTQLLLGETVRVFDTDQGWSWAQADRDGYVGYVPDGALDAAGHGEKPTHRVAVPRTFAYAAPDLKKAAMTALPLGALVAVKAGQTHRNVRYARLADGTWSIAAHLARVDAPEADFVAVAEDLVGTPYLWGGRSAFGIDCSGLVQLAMLMAGRAAPRDSDMQEAELGVPIDPAEGLKRGDLVFWKGHVGIMGDAGTLLHANAHTMDVAAEPLDRAIGRIASLYGAPTRFRRPRAGQ